MICIYHNRDLDGFCSGAIVKRKYPDCKLIGWDYGNPIPEIPDGQIVFLIDISFPIEEMFKLAERSEQVFWLDHHLSAIEEFKAQQNVPSRFNAIVQVGIAACEIGWRYLFPYEGLPEAVELLGEYDTWRKSNQTRWDELILPFQYAMRMKCNSPESFPTDLFEVNNGIFPLIEIGRSILDYQAQLDETNCKKNAFETTFKGFRAICLNGSGFSSNTFKSVYDETRHDLMMPFQFNGRFWTVSLYTTNPDIDCSKLAKEMGGGGHKAAAGFQVDRLTGLFTIVNS